jgi:hypothetical protein
VIDSELPAAAEDPAADRAFYEGFALFVPAASKSWPCYRDPIGTSLGELPLAPTSLKVAIGGKEQKGIRT